MDTGPRHVVGRRAGEPIADLTEHLIVHRAMRDDLARLAVIAAEIATERRCAAARLDALAEYLSALKVLIGSHLRIDESLTDQLAGVTAVPRLRTAGSRRPLARLLDLATMIAGDEAAAHPLDPRGSWLIAALCEAGVIIGAVTLEQERDIFPLIRRHLRAVDHHWVQAEFHADLPAGSLAFVAPWTMVHATERERHALRDTALGVTARIFRQRFVALQARLDGQSE